MACSREKEKAVTVLEEEAGMALVFLSLEDKAETYGYFRAVNGYGLR